jgi:SRSO17 transposase
LPRIAAAFSDFSSRFVSFFQNKTRSVERQARQYLSGLMQAERKNMLRMEEIVPDSDEQSLQHFLSNSPWDHRAVMDHVALDVDRELGGHEDTMLMIDESGLPKKGKESVGVARQWCGQLGKVDNCQVAVFAALGRGERASLVDARLFLPKVWTEDQARCKKAGVPDDARMHRTKHELALDIVEHALELGIRFEWVGVDAFYGENGSLLRALDDAGLRFVADVHRDQRIFMEDPITNPKARGIRADEWAEQQPAQRWRRTQARESTKGTIEVEVLHQRVWLCRDGDEQAYCWHLMVRREPHSETGRTKYTLCNATPDTPVRRLAFLQGQRYWVERVFQDAKQESGLSDYQARGWTAWHHHVAMVSMAMLFMLEQREALREDLPLLTCADIEWALKQLLPTRLTDEVELYRILQERHRKRQAAIDSAYAKQGSVNVTK